VSRRQWIGPACAVLGVGGFSFKAILAKLVYQDPSVDVATLLALRMLYAAPFFTAMAWYGSRRANAHPIARADALRLVWFGFIGYYLSSLLDFSGLRYISASLERLVLYLYPTMVVLLSAFLLKEPITRRAMVAVGLSYAGIVVAFAHDLRFGGDVHDTLQGGMLVFGSAALYALYLVQAGSVIGRIGSMRFIAWAMLTSAVFVLVQFLVVNPLDALAVSPRVHALSLTMAVVSTVLPTWLIAESVRRIGANEASLIGALGPVITMGLGVAILGEPFELVQLAGAALVLCGVLLVTLRPSRAAVTADAGTGAR